ncbi:MAG: hypothetical protein F2793_10375, partial [Actinobacteria bacterium]|nr:hypothetical protein [Actinomycetota bacterium]
SYLDGTAIASIAVNARGQAALVIQVPSEPQSVSFVATYLGDGSAKASSSSPDAVLITPTGSTVALSVPQTNVLRVPTTLVATITPASAGGTVTFSVGNVVVGSQAVAKGQASVEWTPQGAGAFTVSASYSGDRGTPRGTATNQVVVVAETRADSITVDPVGAAGAWVPGGSVTFMNGTSMALATSSTSNMPVQLAESGPCMLAGNRLTARSGSGSCTVTALTRSGNGFSGAANTYRVLLTPGWQTARLAAPASGVVNRGAVVKLGKPNLRTTAGQLVTWKVTAGKAQCAVVFTSDGTAKLKARKRGPCNIRATAPGVDGQWNRYAVYRAYVIR